MKPLSVSIKIWIKTVVFNALLIGLWGVFTGELSALFISFVLMIGGLIITIPLLLPVYWLVKLSVLLPHRIAARIAWLTFYLVVLIALFYLLIAIATHDEKECLLFGTTTTGGLLMAIVTTRTSLYKLNTQSYEQHLV